MLSSGASRFALVGPGLSSPRTVPYRGLGVPLWETAGAAPTLDLNFAENRTLLDSVTGQSLITFTRASSGTYVDADGLIKTAANDVPRFDHDPVTGECLGLLMEEQRTNLLLRSEEFDNASWTKVRLNTVNANSATAVDGTQSADQIVVDTASGTHSIYSNTVASTNATYTASVYLKAGTSNYAFFGLTDLATGGAERRINLLTGEVDTTNIGSSGSWTSISSTVTTIGSGWYRLTITATQGGGTGVALQVLVGNSSGQRSYTGNNTDSVLAWGAQLEVGAFPTSYIPTTDSTATRSADVASISGSNFSSWYRQDEGTVFADYQSIKSSGFCFDATGSASTDRLYLRYLAIQHQFYVIDNGVTQASIYDTTAASLQSARVSAGIAANNFATYANGGGSRASSLAQDASGTMPTLEKMNIGTAFNTTNSMNGHLGRLTYWPQRLPNTTLQSITA